jgi:predicted Zn-dependent peptidase
MFGRRLMLAIVGGAVWTGTVWAQQVTVDEFTLENGMKFLLVPRTEQPDNVAVGWVAKVGSVNERPGITGISHFFEHMMFKGTRAIGTRHPEEEARIMTQQQAVHEQLLKLVWTEQYRRFRAGEIDDPWNPKNDTEEMASLRAQLNALNAEHDKLIVKNEFDSVYTKLGGSGMNAFTTNDLTFYYINVPSNKIELWAWMESDRLSDSVFREFYAERDVVHEERRLRTESTPTGVFQEQFDALFWQSSPYSWPVIGWTSDLNSYTRPEAERYFNLYYRPNNLVGVLVGDFDPAAVKPLIEEYFGRLKRGEQEPPAVVTLEMPQTAEKRFYAECDCQPQIEIRYHTVPFNHADSFALEMMAGILNGRTGRLYKSMIEGKQIAATAQASASELGSPSKFAGFFSFTADVKGEATPQHLEAAWYAELNRLRTQLVSERELQKVKNQFAADAYRRLQSNFFLLLQLGYYEGLGGWRYINESPAKLQQVTPADIQRVATKYFEAANRSVAIYTRKQSAQPVDPELLAIDPQFRNQVAQLLEYAKSKSKPEELQALLAQIQLQLSAMQSKRDQAPPGAIEGLEYAVKKLKARIEEMKAAK